MTLVAKAWYVIASLIYTLAMAFLGTISVWCMLYFCYEAFGYMLPDTMWTSLPGAVFWAMATVTLQLYRARRSAARKDREPVQPKWWSTDLNVQMKLLAILTLLPIATWVLLGPFKWYRWRG